MHLRFLVVCGVAAVLTANPPPLPAEPLIPGTGQKLADVGDDFEDPQWRYDANDPKSSYDLNKDRNYPIGQSENGRWFEGQKRGHPDVVRRIATPDGGLNGSTGSLLLQSLRTGIARRPSGRTQQDDFICDIQSRLGGSIPVSRAPSCTVRVFLPPIAQWEQRSGSHFAFRLGLDHPARKADDRTYWPGMIIVLESQAETGAEHDYAYIRIRGDRSGSDFKGKQITTTGWWTLGMSVTPDGMVHYFAKPGIEDLTADDYITSQYPYGNRATYFRNFFFNVLSRDDGRTWSTPWIIDDASMYIGGHVRTANRR